MRDSLIKFNFTRLTTIYSGWFCNYIQGIGNRNKYEDNQFKYLYTEL